MGEYIRRAGIVKGVEAREHKGEFKNIRISVRFDSELPLAAYVYDNDTQIDEFSFTLPMDTPVNPGDVAVITMEFEKPFGLRFRPALEVGDENPADVLDEDDTHLEDIEITEEVLS